MTRARIVLVLPVLLIATLAAGLPAPSVAQAEATPSLNPGVAIQKAIESPHWWTAGFACLLVLVGIFQVMMFRAQLRLVRRGIEEGAELSKAASESAQSAKASWDIVQRMERAFVTVEVAATALPLASEPRPWTEDGKTNVTAKVIMRNQGRTPAVIRTVDIGLVALLSPPIKFKSFPETQDMIPPALVIGASGSYELQISRSFLRAEWDDMVSGKRMLLCGGKILYDDVLDRLNETGFCWQRTASDGGDRFSAARSAQLNYFRYDLPRQSRDVEMEDARVA